MKIKWLKPNLRIKFNDASKQLFHCFFTIVWRVLFDLDLLRQNTVILRCYLAEVLFKVFPEVGVIRHLQRFFCFGMQLVVRREELCKIFIFKAVF